MNNTKPNLLTLSQEISHLLSKIAEKEMEFFIEDESEILHDFRVDIRKLRTWLQIFNSAGYRVKKLQQHLSYCHLIGDELRNFDVLIHWMKKNPSFICPKSLRNVKLKREKLKKSFIKELTTDNPISKLRILGRDFLSQTIGISKNDFQPSIEKYIEEKRQQASRILPNAAEDLQQLHEIRKIIKKIRYSLDLMPIIDIEKVNALKELQDILGTINDRRVWIEILQLKLKKIEEAPALEAIFREDINTEISKLKVYCASEKNIFNVNLGCY